MNKIIIMAAAVATSGFASASLLWDYGMSTGAYAGSWVNQTGNQNFAEKVSFATGVTVNRYAYITNFDPSTFGTMTVKLLADNAGAPGGYINTQSLTMTGFSALGGGFYEVDLDLTTPYNLAANTTYWIGASGDGFEAAQVSLNTPGDGQMAQFNASTYTNMAGVGDQAFQLYGVVPEPASMLTLGGLALVAARRRRKA